jgi:glutathione S-transferase
MKLFYSPGACSRAPHIVLNELGLKFELDPVNLKTKHFKGGDFFKVNPKGSVPVLQLDNGQILTEGVAIMQYLADQKPEMNLVPKAGTFERYRCQEWLNYISTEIHKGFAPLWNEKTPEEYKKMVIEKLHKQFDFLTTHFKSGNQFLMGAQYTIADAYLFTVLGWAQMVKIDMSKWPELMGYWERVGTRPATVTTLNTESGK